MGSVCKICNLDQLNVKCLPCGHSFCEHCIREFITSRTYDIFGVFPCPICQTTIYVPFGGVSNFSSPLLNPINSAIGRQGSTNFSLTEPISINQTTNGQLVITDRKDNQVLIYNLSGYLQTAFLCNEEINCCVESSRGSLLFANSTEMVPLVLEFDIKGKRFPYIDTLAKYEASFGICLLSYPDEIVVSCPITSSLYFLTSAGKMVKHIGGRGLLGCPTYLASSSIKGYIAVCDSKNNKIKVLKRNGKKLYEIGGLGTKEEQLCQPKGICIIEDKWLLVADNGNRSIKAFLLTNGKFICKIACFDSELLTPIDFVYSQLMQQLFVLLKGQNDNAFIRSIKFEKNILNDSNLITSCIQSSSL